MSSDSHVSVLRWRNLRNDGCLIRDTLYESPMNMNTGIDTIYASVVIKVAAAGVELIEHLDSRLVDEEVNNLGP